jgi:hypothetical protein
MDLLGSGVRAPGGAGARGGIPVGITAGLLWSGARLGKLFRAPRITVASRKLPLLTGGRA